MDSRASALVPRDGNPTRARGIVHPSRTYRVMIGSFQSASRLNGKITMKRYVVTDQTAGVTQGLYETIGEVIAAAVHLQELGRKIHIIDAQGSGAIMVNHFDLLEAEAVVGRGLGSDLIQHPTPIDEVLAHAERTKPPKTVFHWDL